MKSRLKLSFLLSLFCSTTTPINEPLTPKNVDIYSDLDEVLLQQSYSTYRLVQGGIDLDPLNEPTFISSLVGVQQAYTLDPNGVKEALYDRDGNAIEGITFHFLHHGMRDENLTPYVPWLIETLENSRCFIPGTRKIYKHLTKEKGYTINFATNKDRISYDLTAKAFGHKFTNIPDKVFVAHPGNSRTLLNDIMLFANRPTTPDNYKQLVDKTMNVQESDTIIHAPGRNLNLHIISI